jgi:hypothetical protein
VDAVDHPADVVLRPASEPTSASATRRAGVTSATSTAATTTRRSTTSTSRAGAIAGNGHEVIERSTPKRVDDGTGEVCSEAIDLGPKGAHGRAANRNSDHAAI